MSAQSTPPIGWVLRLRSWRNAASLRIAAGIRVSRGVYVETPGVELQPQPPARAARIAALRERYGATFESWLARPTSLNNYAYLDLLDRSFSAAASAPPVAAVMSDVGCASFWYASALQVYFRPAALTGFDVEAWRRYANGHTRREYAQGYAGRWPATSFRGEDYRGVHQPADLITCFYPFLTAAPLVAWGLPIKLLKPKELFASMARNLRPGGGLFMVNHGPAEAEMAGQVARAAGFCPSWSYTEADPLLARPQCPVASYWRR